MYTTKVNPHFIEMGTGGVQRETNAQKNERAILSDGPLGKVAINGSFSDLYE